MKISKRTREQAALICAIAASNPDLHDAYGAVAREAGLRKYRPGTRDHTLALQLALDAWARAASDIGGPRDAEAEAMLRTGWSP